MALIKLTILAALRLQDFWQTALQNTLQHPKCIHLYSTMALGQQVYIYSIILCMYVLSVDINVNYMYRNVYRAKRCLMKWWLWPIERMNTSADPQFGTLPPHAHALT